jgi:hypothetical protein
MSLRGIRQLPDDEVIYKVLRLLLPTKVGIAMTAEKKEHAF